MRKIDNPHEGFLYRVVEWDADNETWFHTSYAHSGRPRTYMTLAAARGIKTSMERTNNSYQYHSSWRERKFAVQKMPVVGWEMVPDNG